MRKHLIIIQASGTFNLEHAKKLIAEASKLGLQIHHASVHHEGHAHITHGTPSDLKEALAMLGVNGPAPIEGQGATLETVSTLLQEVKEGQAETIRLLTEKKGAAPKPPREKKEAAKNKTPDEAPKDTLPLTPKSDTTADAQPPNTPPPPVRDIDGNGVCTVCGAMFESELEAEDHLNGPMCEAKKKD
ncbi:hypothetical protein [Prosthecobacter sp.]|uniref:hypothetical protein n=1 Tax=Prosthecobacter sp. TaxID=1965333 RepID=UPI00378489C1